MRARALWSLALILALALAGCPKAPPPPSTAPAEPEKMVPAEARAFWIRALAAEARGDLAEAERAAGWVIRLDRADPWAWVHVGELYLRIGRPDLAQAAAAAALERDPLLAEAHRLGGRAALAVGRSEEAVEALSRVQGLDVEADLVRALLASGDRPAAEARFAAWAPGAADALDAAALALDLGRPEDALRQARSRLDHPADGPAAAALALQAGLQTCDLADLHAWAVGRRSSAVEPQWRPVLTRIAAEAGDGALTERLLRADPDPGPYASLLVDRGRLEEALSWLGDAPAPEVRGRIRIARGEAPEVAYAEVAEPRRRALLADAALARGDLQAALALTEETSEPSAPAGLGSAAVPPDPSVGWVRAGALAISGRVDEAVAAARSSAEDPVDADLREAQVRALVGDVPGQRAALQAALAADRCSARANLELARISEPCAAVGHLARAAAVRVADPELSRELSAAEAACAALGGD